MRELATQIRGMVWSRGNQRLYLVISVGWAVAFGWFSWPVLPQYQAVDVSQEALDTCTAERNAQADAAGEKAYNACVIKSGKEVTTDIWRNLSNEKVCDIARSAAAVDASSKGDDQLACVFSKEAALAQQLQPIANRAVDNIRRERVIAWTTRTFLPPVALPAVAALLLCAVWLLRKTATWIAEGYKR